MFGPDLLNVLLLEPGGSKFFHFQKKKKFDHVIELIHTRTRLHHRSLVCGSACKSFQAALCYLGPGSLTVPREETFGNLLSRLEEDNSRRGTFYFYFFTGHPGLLCD